MPVAKFEVSDGSELKPHFRSQAQPPGGEERQRQLGTAIGRERQQGGQHHGPDGNHAPERHEFALPRQAATTVRRAACSRIGQLSKAATMLRPMAMIQTSRYEPVASYR